MNKKSSGSGPENILTAMGIRCADHVTPLYPQKLALTSPTGGGRSVGIVRSRTGHGVFFYVRRDEFHQNSKKKGFPGFTFITLH